MDQALISADSHVLEPIDLWPSRIDKRFRDRAPHVVQQKDGRDLFVCEEIKPFPVSGLAVAGVDPKEYGKRMFSGYAGVRPSGWDPVARLRDQAEDGVAGEVLYPSLGMPLYGLSDGEFRAACFRVYNDWLAEYCSHAPARLAGIALVPMDDVAAAVARARAHREPGTARRPDLGRAARRAPLRPARVESAVGTRRRISACRSRCTS